MSSFTGFQHILVATDFSPHADAALKQAILYARQTGAKIVVANVLPDLRKAMLSASPDAQMDIFFGEGDKFQHEIREESEARMRRQIDSLHANDLGIRCETILGDPYIAIIHAVQTEHYDLVLVGTRRLPGWERFIMGSTAKRLIRNCPCPVWTVKDQPEIAPKVIMAATDFSEVSRQSVAIASQIAAQTGAAFHLLHVIESQDIPDRLIERLPPGSSFREEVNMATQRHLDQLVASVIGDVSQVQPHLSWGTPSQEIARTATELKVDLLVLGTVGRSGIKGVVLGNTAEKVLDHCDCSILTVKPDDFVSPIPPPFWPLHPESPGS